MTFSRRRFLAATPLLAASACHRRARSEDAPIEVVIPDGPMSLDPRFASDLYAHRTARLVYATLTAPDVSSLAPSPSMIVETLEIERDRVTARLQRGACFHDGSPLGARDVVATLHALADPTLGAPFGRVARTFSAIEALDDRTIRITSATPRATLANDLDVPILKESEARLPRGASPMGSGPFRIDGHDDGATTLVPATSVEAFAQPRARRAVTLRVVRDEAARAMRVLAGGGDRGGADIVPNAFRPPIAIALPARSDSPPGLVAHRCAAAATTMLVLHHGHPPFDRADVRRAVSLAIDRRALVAAEIGGAATIATGLLPPCLGIERTASTSPSFDPAPARAVLSRVSQASPLTLVVTSDRGRLTVARAIAQMLGDVGLNVEVRSLELGTALARLASGAFDLTLLVSSELTDPDVLRWYLHSSATPPNGANRGRVHDAEIDRLLDTGLAAQGAERRAIYAALEDRVAALAAIVPLWHEDNIAVVGARASRFRPRADGRWTALADLA